MPATSAVMNPGVVSSFSMCRKRKLRAKLTQMSREPSRSKAQAPRLSEQGHDMNDAVEPGSAWICRRTSAPSGGTMPEQSDAHGTPLMEPVTVPDPEPDFL